MPDFVYFCPRIAKITLMDDSQLKERMGWLRGELLALVTDDDTYWRLQEDVIKRNPRLLRMRSPYFDMLNFAYVSTTTSAIRRLTEKQNRDKTNVSLSIVLEKLEKRQTISGNQVPQLQIRLDLVRLEDLANVVKPYVDRIIAHQRQARDCRTAEIRQSRKCVSILADTFRRYYVLIEGVDLELKIEYLEDFDIFKFPWIAN